jgi:hypothetical protein
MIAQPSPARDAETGNHAVDTPEYRYYDWSPNQ